MFPTAAEFGGVKGEDNFRRKLYICGKDTHLSPFVSLQPSLISEK
jgi:hypothetical protein